MDPVAPGPRLSNYRLDRLIGSGGMGSVYLAHDLALDRPVAIKFIAPDKAADEASRRRLLREARAAAALDHPNICGVHEVIDEPDGRTCIVMQYVQGQTLADKLRSGPLDVRLALSVATDVAEALEAAHAHNIIHRDIKPQNIILTAGNQAKLLDFGLAVHSLAGDYAGADSTTTNLTTPGAVAGTLPYMSPEQVAQRPLDGRSDLFSLGTVLHECLTGKRPFTGPSSAEVASSILRHDPPPVSSIRPELNEHHDELCRRLLAKHPDDRFRSAEELLGALRVSSASGAVSGVHRLPARRRSTTAKLAVAVAVVAVLAAIGVWKWTGARAEFVAPPEAHSRYERGTAFIRDGAYNNARATLSRAVQLAPGYVPAYVRLAEACTELDDHQCAQDALNTVGTLAPDERRLSDQDRVRVRAVRALMLRRVDDVVAEYDRLTKLKPSDSGAWLDLGRAQDAAAQPVLARASFDRAIQLDPENAAAHLRRATVVSQVGEKEEALKAFARAEELYRKTADAEGIAETLLRRGTYLSGVGDSKLARQVLEKAASLAETLDHREQFIRAQLELSSVTATEGAYGKAHQIANDAVQMALKDGLDTVAAEGLIDLGSALFRSRIREAPNATVFQSIDVHFVRALDLATRRNAQRIAARASMQRAALLTQFDQPAQALEIETRVLPFLREKQYRRYELQLLLIMARTLPDLGRAGEGRQISAEVLTLADQLGDEAAAAFALENLAGFTVDEGNLPLAEQYRARTESINRKQNTLDKLPYDLTNRAELLIRLGRGPESEPLLAELHAGAAKGIESFRERERRAKAIRGLRHAVEGKFNEIAGVALPLFRDPVGIQDSSGKLAIALFTYAEARLGRPIGKDVWSTSRTAAASTEPRYWVAYADLLVGDHQSALKAAEESLADAKVTSSAEVEWRLAAIGAAAARGLKDAARSTALSQRAHQARSRLRLQWKDGLQGYESRADLVDIVRRSGLEQQR